MNDKKPISYPQAWYPLTKSSQIKENTIKSIRAFENDWLLYRDENNQPTLVGRYCCHIGVDLINGQMKNGCIVCPLHGWQFGKNGECHLIPALKNKMSADKADYEKQKKQRKLKSLPCKEAYGLIFVFLGETPTYDVPLPAKMRSVQYGLSEQLLFSGEHHVLCLNTFDLQHYQAIHHRQLTRSAKIESISPHHLGITMNVKILPITLLDKFMAKLVKGSNTISIDCWGASILIMKNSKTGYGAVFSILPVEEHQSDIFMVAIKEESTQQNVFTGIRDYLSLVIAVKIVRRFLLADEPVLTAITRLK